MELFHRTLDVQCVQPLCSVLNDAIEGVAQPAPLSTRPIPCFPPRRGGKREVLHTGLKMTTC